MNPSCFKLSRGARRGAAALALLLASFGASAFQWDDPPPRKAPHEDPAFHAALQACAAEQGLPAPGADKPREEAKSDTPPKRPDRERMDTCLRGKGFTPPQFRGRGGPPPMPPEDEEE